MLTAYCDGACRVSNPGLSSCSWVLYEDDKEVSFGGRYLGVQTNNYAEFQGLLSLLFVLAYRGLRRVNIFSDSKLVVDGTNLTWAITKPELKEMALEAYGLLARGGHKLEHVDGHSGVLGNERADFLCNEILDKEGIGLG